MSKRRKDEIELISDHPGRRPYAARVGVLFEEGMEYLFTGEACLLIDPDFIVRVRPEKPRADEEWPNSQRLTATIEGFATASQAEQMGLRLSLALLWSAVSVRHHLRLEYHTPQPCVVFDRTEKRTSGFSISGTWRLSADPGRLSGAINEVLKREADVDPRLLISMELFASSMLELTERARFISLVSSLEPLASQEPYKNERLESTISQLVEQLSALSLPEGTRESIVGRARDLSRESISQSIIRLIRTHMPDNPGVTELVKEAYEIRSKILHEGKFDADLQEKGGRLADVIRYIYGRILQLELNVPAKID